MEEAGGVAVVIEFVQPWMLLGVLGAAVPLWLHLFGRRRAPVLYFSALEFILAANPKKARALALREWTLLALRCLVVFAVAVALARPSVPLPGRAAEVAIAAGPQALVLVLDDSMSMAAGSQGEASFERARRRALALVADLPLGARAAVVASGFPARTLVQQLTGDRQALLRALDALRWRPRRDDAGRALHLAQSLLEGATDVPSRRVVILTDLQASGWQAADMPGLADRGQPVQTFVERFAPDSVENTAIVDATVDRGADKTGAQLRVEVSLVHHGHKAWRDYVSVRAAEREFKSLVQLQPGEVARRSFLVPASAQWAEVVLPGDSLEVDNRRLVRLDAATALKIAVINGAPRPVPRDDEAFFVAQALESGSAGPGELQVDRIAADKLTSAALADHDVVIAANLGSPPAQTLQALLEFARGGGGVLVTLGDNLPDPPGDYLAALLPARLGGVRSSGPAGAAAAPGLALDPGAADPAGLCSAAAAIARELHDAQVGLSEARAGRYVLPLPTPELASRTVLRFGDGAPALLAHGVGAGRVALWTTTIDRDWTDLPLQPAWLPFVHGTVRALAGPRALERKAAIEVGQVATLGRDDRAEQLQVRVEGGAAAGQGDHVAQAVLQKAGQWSISGLEVPGRYMATELRAGAALNSRPIVVVAPGSEGDLAAAVTGPLAARSAQLAQVGAVRTVPKSPVWTPALVALLLLLMTEAALVARGAWPVRGWVWRKVV